MRAAHNYPFVKDFTWAPTGCSGSYARSMDTSPETGRPDPDTWGLEARALNLEIGMLWREIRRGAAATRLSDYIYREGPDGMDIGLIRLIEACVALGPCRVVDLAGFMDVTPSTVSRAVARLEEMGLVVRNAVDADKRAVEVEVTAAGRSRHDIFMRRGQFAVEKILADHTDEERAQLAGHLRRLTGRIDEFLDQYEGQRLPPA